jgi:serine/threonine protein kinase
MISRYWSLKLSDYGLNDVLDEMTRADVTTAHEPLVDGTVGARLSSAILTHAVLNHIAPELIMQRRSHSAPFPASFTGDVYAVGCVLYQILYRRPLISDLQMWSGGSLFQIFSFFHNRLHNLLFSWCRLYQ